MKKCEKCSKPIFACCGNEPGRFCHRCGGSSARSAGEAGGEKPPGKVGGASDG